jgi:hypothetical protein
MVMNGINIMHFFSDCFKESDKITNKISYDYSKKKFELVQEQYVYVKYTQYGFFVKVCFNGSIDVVIFKNVNYKQEIEDLRNHFKDHTTTDDTLLCFIPFSGILLLRNINNYVFNKHEVEDELATINNVDINNIEIVAILDRLEYMFSLLKKRVDEDGSE